MRNVARICFSLFFLVLVSCRTNERSVAETFSHSNIVERVVSDSVALHDSVVILARTDTVFFTKYRTLYKEKLRHDTVVRCDTVYIERTVTGGNAVNKSRRFSWWAFVPLAAMLLLLWRSGLFRFMWNFFNIK